MTDLRLRSLRIAAVFLALAADPAQGGGAFVTRTIQNEIGQKTPTLYFDLSGTGAGPFQPVFVCIDSAGNVCAAIAAGTGTLSQTTDVSCAATSPCQLSSATSRHYLSIVNTSAAGVCRIGYGAAPTASRGDPLGAAAVAGGQGGSRTFESSFVPSGPVSAFCTVASTLAVMEAP